MKKKTKLMLFKIINLIIFSIHLDSDQYLIKNQKKNKLFQLKVI